MEEQQADLARPDDGADRHLRLKENPVQCRIFRLLPERRGPRTPAR